MQVNHSRIKYHIRHGHLLLLKPKITIPNIITVHIEKQNFFTLMKTL